MDRVLRPYKGFCRAFIDDVVIYSKTEKEHLQHLSKIFQLFERFNLTMSPKKSWIGYPSVQLLGFRVDAFGMSTTEHRLAAFAKLEFPDQLSVLESYIGATGYIRHLLPYYGALIEPLQRRKTQLLAQGREIGKIQQGNINKRRAFARNTKFEPSEKERLAFEAIQKEVASGRMIHHMDPSRQLFCQVDGSLQRGFACTYFHLKEGYEWKPGQAISSTAMQPIAFLSRTLTNAERSYGPSELEVACLVWAIKKMRTMVQSSTKPLIVLTDHSATQQIVNKTSLDTSSTDRANRRLVVASIYLSQYELQVDHLPGKINFIPDALSRLSAPETDQLIERQRPDYTALDDVLLASEAIMDPAYRIKFKEGYQADTHYRKILQ
ncbi:reverse transcriptase (RNA-dependent DNA polymerase) [Hirsutella rhossiliensis]